MDFNLSQTSISAEQDPAGIFTDFTEYFTRLPRQSISPFSLSFSHIPGGTTFEKPLAANEGGPTGTSPVVSNRLERRRSSSARVFGKRLSFSFSFTSLFEPAPTVSPQDTYINPPYFFPDSHPGSLSSSSAPPVQNPSRDTNEPEVSPGAVDLVNEEDDDDAFSIPEESYESGDDYDYVDAQYSFRYVDVHAPAPYRAASVDFNEDDTAYGSTELSDDEDAPLVDLSLHLGLGSRMDHALGNRSLLVGVNNHLGEDSRVVSYVEDEGALLDEEEEFAVEAMVIDTPSGHPSRVINLLPRRTRKSASIAPSPVRRSARVFTASPHVTSPPTASKRKADSFNTDSPRKKVTLLNAPVQHMVPESSRRSTRVATQHDVEFVFLSAPPPLPFKRTTRRADPRRDGLRTFKCHHEGCNHAAFSLADLRRHLRSRKHASPAWQCYGCNQFYSRKDSLERHIDSDVGIPCRSEHNAKVLSLAQNSAHPETRSSSRG